MLQPLRCSLRACFVTIVLTGLIGACATQPKPSAPPAARRSPLSLTYLGVAGWIISHEHTTVLIDPYLSRPSLDADAPAVVDERAIAAHVPSHAQLVLVTHSHFDHLLDAPAVARITGAQLMGTVSTARYGRACGLESDRVIPVAGGADYAFDGYSVKVIPSLHSALDDKHTFGAGEEIAADAAAPFKPSQFAEGGTLAYLLRLGEHRVLVLGTANYIEREIDQLHPTVAIVATGLRQEIHDYTGRLLRSWDAPSHIVANHFDDHRAALVPIPPLSPEAQSDLAAFVQEVQRAQSTLGGSRESKVVIPERFQTITVD